MSDMIEMFVVAATMAAVVGLGLAVGYPLRQWLRRRQQERRGGASGRRRH